ncbi:MAG: transporter, family, 4-hydroxybenzoate transporter [Gammaproteobacteria bacterium]|nr:transporter, family, 4-hydroxybenzoate transporter [Gammaproteobacteria bacterium]
MTSQHSSSPFARWLVCFLIAMIDGYDTLMLSFIAPLITKEWHVQPAVIGSIFAATYAGAAVGATSLGAAADRFGRRRTLLSCLIIAGVFTVLSAWSRDPAQLMVLRAAAGLGLGGAIPIISALAAAGAPADNRRAAVTRVFIGYPIGAMAGGVVTAAVMATVGWRGVLIGGGGLTLLITATAYLVVPKEASAPLLTGSPLRTHHPLVALVADGRVLQTVLICVAAFSILLVSYFLVSWMPLVLTLNGMDARKAALSGVLLNLGGLIGGWCLSTLVGRRSPSLAVAICLGVGSAAIALLGLGPVGAGLSAFLLVAAVGVLIIGAQINIPALTAHLYPPEICATGVGLAMAVGRLGSIVGPLAGGYLVSERLGWNRLFLLAAVPALLAAAAIAALGLRSRAPVSGT